MVWHDCRHETLALPAGHEIVDVSADEKFLLSRTRPEQQWEMETAHIVPLDTLASHKLSAQPFQAMRISPDGKHVIGCRSGMKGDRPTPGALDLLRDKTMNTAQGE